MIVSAIIFVSLFLMINVVKHKFFLLLFQLFSFHTHLCALRQKFYINISHILPTSTN